MSRIRKIVCLLCTLILCLSMLSGCGAGDEKTNKKVVMTVGEYEINHDELMLYCILELLSGTMTYQDVVADEAKYKQQVLDSLVKTKMLNDAATLEKLEFNKNDEETRDRLIDNFTSYVPKDVLKKYGISEEVVKSVFQDTSVMNKLSNDTRNEMGKRLNEKYLEEFKDYNFQRIYYVTFPKVEADEDGNPLITEDGTYVMLDDETKAARKNDAEAAVKEINAGADAKEVAKKYGVDAYSEEKSCYVGGYSSDMNDVMANLKAGQCTDVYETDAGYYFIAVLSDHDSELLESFAYEYASIMVDEEYNKQEEEWIFTYEDKGGVNFKDNTWKEFSLLDMATYLNEKGLMQ